MTQLTFDGRTIPEGWSVKPLKAVAEYFVSNVDKVPDEQEEPIRLCNYNDVYKNEFISASSMDLMRSTATRREIEKFRLLNGDVVITKDSETWEDIAVPALVVESADDLVCGYHLAILRPTNGEMLGRFLFRCLQSKAIRLPLELASTGITRFGLPKDEIGKLSLPIPPRSVQVSIANYLDAETAEIDALIAEKEQMLALLEEQRAAVVTHAVTRGLNPGVPMKSSGLDWLGGVPKHWRIERLKYWSPEVTVGIVVTPAKYYVDAGVPCLRSLNVRPCGFRDSDLVFISEESNQLHAKSIIWKDDLVAVRTGQPGTTAVVDQRFDGSNCIDLIIIRKSASFVSRYLCYFMNSSAAHAQYESGSVGGLQQHFNVETAANLLVAWPPTEEQETIVANLHMRFSRSKGIEDTLWNSIDLLKERRSALITAAVTGQISIEEMES